MVAMGQGPNQAMPQGPPGQPPVKVDPDGKYTPKQWEAPVGAPMQREVAEAKLREALKVENDGPNRYRIGTVTFDSKRRIVTIPAVVNMENGAVEYLLVTNQGKTHEAVFRTDAKAEEVHLACLLLGMRPLEEGRVDAPAANGVKVSVEWDTNGPMAEYPLSAMVATHATEEGKSNGQQLVNGPWTYTGSRTDAGGFAAAREGSIIALILDSVALLGRQRDGSTKDQVYEPNRQVLPPKDSPVRIVLTLPAKS